MSSLTERPPLYKRIYRVLWEAATEFGKDMAVRSAAALSFYTLFSIVPLLFLIVAVVGFVSSDSALLVDDCSTVTAADLPAEPVNPLDRAISQVDELAGPAVADQLAALTCQAARTASGALWIGVILAAFSGSAIFRHLQGVLNNIFGAPEELTKGIVNQVVTRGVAVGAALLLGVLVLVPIVAVAGVNFVRGLITVSWLQRLLTITVPLTSLVMLVAVIGATYALLPRVDVPLKAARAGALFTSASGLIGAYLVGAYLSSDLITGGALGAIGGVAVLLFFFNLMWMIYLMGAEVTKVLTQRAGTDAGASPPEVEDALALVGGRPARPESPLRTGVMAFLIGLVTGWAARKDR